MGQGGGGEDVGNDLKGKYHLLSRLLLHTVLHSSYTLFMTRALLCAHAHEGDDALVWRRAFGARGFAQIAIREYIIPTLSFQPRESQPRCTIWN